MNPITESAGIMRWKTLACYFWH